MHARGSGRQANCFATHFSNQSVTYSAFKKVHTIKTSCLWWFLLFQNPDTLNSSCGLLIWSGRRKKQFFQSSCLKNQWGNTELKKKICTAWNLWSTFYSTSLGSCSENSEAALKLLEGQAFGLWVKTLAFCTGVPEFESQIDFRFQLSANADLGRRWKRLNFLGPCSYCGRSVLSSHLLSMVCPIPGHWIHLGSTSEWKLPLSLR